MVGKNIQGHVEAMKEEWGSLEYTIIGGGSAVYSFLFIPLPNLGQLGCLSPSLYYYSLYILLFEQTTLEVDTKLM
jgi:hypothetical protein